MRTITDQIEETVKTINNYKAGIAKASQEINLDEIDDELLREEFGNRTFEGSQLQKQMLESIETNKKYLAELMNKKLSNGELTKQEMTWAVDFEIADQLIDAQFND